MDKKIKQKLEKIVKGKLTGLKEATKVFTMEDFRKLGMGLQAQIEGKIVAPSNSVAGDILYHTGSAWTRLAKGDDAQVLTLDSGLPSWAAAGGGGGASAFVGLNDTPSAYAGEATKHLRVNAGEDAIEFVTLAPAWGTITGNLSAQTDLDSALGLKQDNLTFSTGLSEAGGTVTTDDTEIDHDNLLNFDANEHFLQSAITNVNTSVGAGIVTNTSAGVLNHITDNSSNWDDAYTHSEDNTQAHTDYLLNSGADTMAGILTCNGVTTTGSLIAGDHGTATAHSTVNVIYGTASASPIAASATPIGTIYVQYTA